MLGWLLGKRAPAPRRTTAPATTKTRRKKAAPKKKAPTKATKRLTPKPRTAPTTSRPMLHWQDALARGHRLSGPQRKQRGAEIRAERVAFFRSQGANGARQCCLPGCQERVSTTHYHPFCRGHFRALPQALTLRYSDAVEEGQQTIAPTPAQAAWMGAAERALRLSAGTLNGVGFYAFATPPAPGEEYVLASPCEECEGWHVWGYRALDHWGNRVIGRCHLLPRVYNYRSTGERHDFQRHEALRVPRWLAESTTHSTHTQEEVDKLVEHYRRGRDERRQEREREGRAWKLLGI